jgi:hypothetical protein
MFRHTTMSDEQRQGLIDDHFLFRGKDSMQAASGYHEYWPEGRGVYHNTEKTFVNWLNEVRPACSQLHIVVMRRLRERAYAFYTLGLTAGHRRAITCGLSRWSRVLLPAARQNFGSVCYAQLHNLTTWRPCRWRRAGRLHAACEGREDDRGGRIEGNWREPGAIHRAPCSQ